MHILLAVAAVLGLGAWFWHRSVNVLATVGVQGGRCTLRSGELPPGMLSSIGTACRLSGFQTGTITVRRGGQVSTRPSDPGLEQRLRNAIGSRGLGKLRTEGDGWRDKVNGIAERLALSSLISWLLRKGRR